jgi:hypothetical protein
MTIAAGVLDQQLVFKRISIQIFTSVRIRIHSSDSLNTGSRSGSRRAKSMLPVQTGSGTLVAASVADPGCLSRVPDTGSEFFHPASRIQGQKDSGSRIRISIKEFNYF